MNALDYKIEALSAKQLADWNAPQLSKETAYQTILKALRDGFEGNTYEDLFDLFQNFNHLTCFYSVAEAMLYNYNIFDAIAEITEYEIEHFGQIYTDLSNSYQIATSLWRMLGESVLNEIPELVEYLDKQITEKHTQEILQALEEIYEIAV